MAVIGSVTQAMRAQRVLNGAAILCDVIKADSAKGSRGCVYALSYDCVQNANVRRILERAGIRPRDFYETQKR